MSASKNPPSSERKKQFESYLSDKVDRVMKRLLYDLLKEKPDDVIGYIEQWARKEKENPELASSSVRQSALASPPTEKPQYHQSDESDQEDSPDHQLSEKAKKKMQAKVSRQGVSAEAYGKYNKKEDFVPKVIPKPEDTKNRIMERLNKNFLFRSLDHENKEIVIDAMEERKFNKGQYVIKQGEDGDVLYLVDTGILTCTKRFPGQTQETFLLKYKSGDAFGELALLYNAPRAATIIADEDSVLYALDRATFNNIVKEASMKRRERYEAFLSKVELLSPLDTYERSKICDVLETEVFQDGQAVVKQGEKGDKFYFIEDGEAVALKHNDGDSKSTIVFEYKPNDYFGELALLSDAPRQATIVAKGKLRVASIDREAFKRLLGPLEDLLKRNTTKYDNYLASKQKA